MSDEIDIEEHDLLENPTLRKIFPDITAIKKEITSYEEGFAPLEETSSNEIPDTIEEDSNDQIDEPCEVKNIEKKSQPSSTSDRLEVHLRFKTFLASLEDDSSENTDNTDIQSVSNQQVDDYIPSNLKSVKKSVLNSAPANRDMKLIKSNILILGSKPNITSPDKKKEKKHLKVILKNVSPYLHKSKQFCDQCLILFPNVNALTSHVKDTHTPTPQNSPHSEVEENVMAFQKSRGNKFQCSICTVTLSSKGNLYRHFKMVHNMKKAARLLNAKKEIRKSSRQNIELSKTQSQSHERKIQSKTHSKKQSTSSSKCFHCTKIFTTRSSLIEHLYEVITPNKSTNKNSKSLQDMKDTNNKDTEVIDDQPTYSKDIECKECGIKFSSLNKLDQHNKVVHLKNKDVPNTVTSPSRNKEQSKNKYKVVPKASTRPKRQLGPKENVIVNNTPKRQLRSKVNGIANNTPKRQLSSKENGIVNNTPKRQLRPKESGIVNKTASSNYVSSHEDAEDLESDVEQKSDAEKTKKFVYQCFVCYRYMSNFKDYGDHMSSHNITNVKEGDKVVYNPSCNYCSSTIQSMGNFNMHISKYHLNKNKFEGKAYKSVLFKCTKCDICVLSAYAAVLHTEHEDAATWKCLECLRVFLYKDKLLHLKQHTVSCKITCYELCERTLSRVLFKCLKCGVHFREHEYLLHDGRCDSEIPNSTHCNACHILINENNMLSHTYFHKENSSQYFDFTFIESDVIEYILSFPLEKNALTYCQECNCFLGHQGSRHKSHRAGECSKSITPRICTKCGLVLTPRGYVTHQRLHEKFKNLNMQSFYFYDIVSERQIRPPVAKYPSCSNCKVHYINTSVHKKTHECSKQAYTKCNVCQILITESALRLHKNYHNYRLLSTGKNKIKDLDSDIEIDPAVTAADKPDLNSEKHINSTKSMIESSTSILPKDDKTLDLPTNPSVQRTIYVYNCVYCNINFDNYDTVVQHCHDHYDFKKKIPVTNIKKIHSNVKGDCTLLFDPFYFRFDNDVWIKHIFANARKNDVKGLLKKSIYKFECRLKMEEGQTGQITLYKCDICQAFVSPKTLYSHTTLKCVFGKKHKCTKCDLNFYSKNYRRFHEKFHHKSPDTSYKIVLYNKRKNQQFTKMIADSVNKFIMYQCRKCSVVVDRAVREKHQCRHHDIRKCLFCGLLLHDIDYNNHLVKHRNIPNFNPQHIVIILFGRLKSYANNKLKPSFEGTIHDLTFYKCTKCELCLNTKSCIYKHVCVDKTSKFQCPKCCLCFMNNDTNVHFQLHENNLELDYDDFNSNVIPFTSALPEEKHDKLEQKVNPIVINSDQSENSDIASFTKANNENADTLLHANNKNNADGENITNKENVDIIAITNKSNCEKNSIINSIKNELSDGENLGRDHTVNKSFLDEKENKNIPQAIITPSIESPSKAPIINNKINNENSENVHLLEKHENENKKNGDNDQETGNSEPKVEPIIHEERNIVREDNTESINATDDITNKDVAHVIEENTKVNDTQIISISSSNSNIQTINVDDNENLKCENVNDNENTNKNETVDVHDTDSSQSVDNMNKNEDSSDFNTGNKILKTYINKKRKLNTDSSDEQPQKVQKTDVDKSSYKAQDETENPEILQNIYKCTCGLHFVEEFDAKKHFYNCNPKLKISKQSCFKCNLLFTPGELFNHLLKHHDKKLKYIYTIIDVSS